MALHATLWNIKLTANKEGKSVNPRQSEKSKYCIAWLFSPWLQDKTKISVRLNTLERKQDLCTYLLFLDSVPIALSRFKAFLTRSVVVDEWRCWKNNHQRSTEISIIIDPRVFFYSSAQTAYFYAYFYNAFKQAPAVSGFSCTASGLYSGQTCRTCPVPAKTHAYERLNFWHFCFQSPKLSQSLKN